MSSSITTLGDLVEFQRGFDLPKTEFINGNIPVISSNGILGYHNIAKVKGPGITIGRSGTVGLPHFIKEDFYPHNTSLFIKDFKGNVPKYIYYLLRTLKLNEYGSGSGVPTMNRNHLHPIKLFACLEKGTQQKIASVLSALDDKIELNNRINAELEAMAKTLYDYWFVQFDFPNEEAKPYKSSGGKMVYNETLKREIPEGWEVKSLGELVKTINTGLNPRDHFKLGEGENFYVTIKNIEYGRIILDNSCDRISNNSLYRIQKRSNLEKGDILFTSIEPVGKTYLLQENPTNWNINESVFSFKPNYKYVTSEFLFMLLSSYEIRMKCKNAATGSIHKGIRITPLKNFQIPLPPLKLITDFNSILKEILFKINNNQKQNQELSALRDWLLPMLMNGQVKVG
ncbi:restriction endonuclease subunit S [Epilithonimonas sp.]|uniref:restriction endonuclease subunit S n=1 Tax=Epilithonimonas sp. TaxID=2894511 RepID=UPI0028966DBA|nr:restriction endonuclease subunit S [Epilithonimonas sp.]